MADQPPPDTTTDAPENTPEADRFRDRTVALIHSLGREGVDHALETLFEISDEVLNGRRCARHTVERVTSILNAAFDSDSEECGEECS